MKTCTKKSRNPQIAWQRLLPSGTGMIADHTQSVVDTALRLLNDHLVAATHEDGDGLGVVAFLDEDHSVLRRAERDLPHHACPAQRRQESTE